MDRIRVSQSRNDDVEWTELSTRACRGAAGGTGARVEFHIEHFRHRFLAKRGSTHLNYPTLSIAEAEQFRDNLSRAIADAQEMSAGRPARPNQQRKDRAQ